MADFELPACFYLGRGVDPARGAPASDLVLVDAKDFTTHAVIVGMTGSGKTGLGIALIEEAALDGVPALVVDPKGDLANLLLTFPGLTAEEFAPWLPPPAPGESADPAARAGKAAEAWRKGLAEWGVDGARIARLRQSAEFTVYTPGSNAGVPISILGGLAAPPAAEREDAELLGMLAGNAASSLLGIAGAGGEGSLSREHVLIANILHHSWNAGRDLDLGVLIQQIQQPPFQRLGVLELESFYSAKDRFALAMAFNNLLAAPGFARWLEGAPLDVGRLLWTDQGKPRVAVLSIAHLNDAERMFFVSLLLNQTLAWMRAQSGTSTLRALLYMDEIAGCMPPVANPPSKPPLLTLMKQARAFGLGVVVATQNPVDVDYKGLSNAGVWLIGRLQTEQDKARVLDGLTGADGSLDRAGADALLSQLDKRQFLLHDVHRGRPQVMQTRFCMSYLRGPMSREEIKRLTMGGTVAPTAAAAAAVPAPVPAPAAATPALGTNSATPPVLPPEIPQFFVAGAGGGLRYVPHVFGSATVRFADARSGVDLTRVVTQLAPFNDGVVPVKWELARNAGIAEDSLMHEPLPAATWSPLPPAAADKKSWPAWQKAFTDHLARTQELALWSAPGLKMVSEPGEDERAFRLRVQQSLRERRDLAADFLRRKFSGRLTVAQERVRKSEQRIGAQADQASKAKSDSLLSIGGAILAGFFGGTRSGNISRGTSAAKTAGRVTREAKDVERAKEDLTSAQAALAELARQAQDAMRAEMEKIDSMGKIVEPLVLRPKRTHVSVRAVVLAWVPV
jgi:hypothetical protein